MNTFLSLKRIAIFCVIISFFSSLAFAFSPSNGEVSFTRLRYGNFYDYPDSNDTFIRHISPYSSQRFNWEISGKTDLIKQYSITFQCAPVSDYSKAQSKYYSYIVYGQANSFDWEVDQDSRNYPGAPKNCFCKASIIAQGDVDSAYGEPKPLGEAQTYWFSICDKPEIIKPWIQLLPIQQGETGTTFNLELLSKGNDVSNPSVVFKVFPRDILFEENQKNVITIKPNSRSTPSNLLGQWFGYFDTDDQTFRPAFKIFSRGLNLNDNYCYQAQATNSRGATVTPASCLADNDTLINLPKVANKSAIVAGNNTAYITGSLINTGGSPKLYFWVLAKDYFDTKNPKKTFSSGTDFRVTKIGDYQFKIAGLDVDTSYCYYTTARNEAGFSTTDNSNTLDCFVTAGKDWVKTLPSSYVEVNATNAGETKLFATTYSVGAGNKNINLTAKGWFEYDLKSNIPTDISKIDLPKTTEKISFQFNPVLDSRGKNFSIKMPEKLLSGKQYCYRAVLENSLGIKKKGNLECFSFGGSEAVASIPEGIKFVASNNGETIQRIVLKGTVLFPRNVEVAYFIWQRGVQDSKTHKTTYTDRTGWTGTSRIAPLNGNWANMKNTFYGEINNPKPGEKYCYKAVSHYNQDWMSVYYPMDESKLHCFVVPYRPEVETYSADLGADLSIVKLQGKIKNAGFNDVWTDDGKNKIGDLLYEKQIILERKDNKTSLSDDNARLTQINGIIGSFTEKYCQEIACGADVYFNVYPENIGASNKEVIAMRQNVLSQFATDTDTHTNLEYFSYQLSNGVFKELLSPYNVSRCVKYECGSKAWGGVCQQVVYSGNDCSRKGNASCRWDNQGCSDVKPNNGVFCEWSSFNKEKEKCEFYQITFPKGTTCPISEQRCLGINYEYKARAKNVAWYDISSNPKTFIITTEPIPYGQSIAFWDKCQRSTGGLSTMRASGCADTSMTMAIAYWYKNDSNVKLAWDSLINKYFNQIRDWESEQESGCKNPGLDYKTPNPFTFLYIARNATDNDGSIAYGAIGKGGQWNTAQMTRMLQDINIIPSYLTGHSTSESNYLSFERAADNLSNGRVIVIRRPTGTAGGTGHWLYFNSYDSNNKTINGIDSWDGSYVSYTKSQYQAIGFGYEYSNYGEEVDNWALAPDRYPILQALNQIDLLKYNEEDKTATIKFWATIKKVGSNDNEIKVIFYLAPVTDKGDDIYSLDGINYPIASKEQKSIIKSQVNISQNMEDIKIKDNQIYCYWAKGSNMYYSSSATDKVCFKINSGKLEKITIIPPNQQ